MSSYFNRLIFLIFITFQGCVNAQPSHDSFNITNRSDMLILLALDYEIKNDYPNTALVYTKLYEYDKKFEYLNKAISYNLLSKNYKVLKDLTSNNLVKYPKVDEKYRRLLILSLLNLNDKKQALIEAKELIKKYNNVISYDIIGNVYYSIGKFKKAASYFESAYATNQKASTLVSLTNVLYAYLNQKDKAVSYLETYVRQKGCQEVVCNKLISFYQEQQNIEGMISILKMSLKSSKNKATYYRNVALLVNTLEKKDINSAIEFLEKHPVDNAKLLTLYDKTGQNQKALTFVRKLYKKTKNKELLGAIAIFEFQTAKNKKEVMKHVIANFEQVIKITKNSNYKNYYGYLLIDYGINIKKGLKLVKEALKVSNNNIAYLDSLSWGYYKLGDCTKAYKHMKYIIDQVGLDNEEIKLHWEKIQKCHKK